MTDNLIKVIIKLLDGATLDVQIAPNATVENLKRSIEQERDISPERQRLIFRGQELKNDTNLLSEYGVVDQSTLHMVIRPIRNEPINNHDANQGDVAVDIPQRGKNKLDFLFLLKQTKKRNPYGYNNVPNEEVIQGQEEVEHDTSVLEVMRLCRFVRMFAMMDFIILVLFALTLSFFFLFMALLALAGYYGAKILKRSYLAAYMICLVMEIGVRVYFIYANSSKVVSVILFILMILIDFFVLKCLVHLYKIIPYLNMSQIRQILIFNRVGLF
ncbi:ubiquitin [Reticulomyxa filosa]|uniref:Ubiquitin n=1 Tax=Reticulomyxa filosa TaxID=46433 RepID=X6NLH1_RETFI|nr:ubiquitin [Reticulomyxa filosa]|eukprot:ETO26836.1 ubiquitin [Reticulomyxa filosa]